MRFIRMDIPDIILIEPKIFRDSRGYFFESFRADKLKEFLGYEINFCQDNESKSNRGVLRGLHYQLPPFAQTKLVRVIKGSVLDVAVDIREGSKTFGRYVAVELNDINKRQLLIPKGFAHGFLTLEDGTIFAYKVDNYYSPQNERSIRFDDPNINIDWNFPKSEILVSDKDRDAPFFESTEIFN